MMGAWLAELMKFKRSRMNILIVLGALVPGFLNYMIARHDLSGTPRIAWDSLLNGNLMIMALLMAPALFSLFTGYVYAREYQERVINQLYTSAKRRWVLLLAKWLALLPVMAVTLALAYGAALLGGFLLPHEPLTAAIAWTYTRGYALLLVTQAALIPCGMLASLLGRTYIPSMAVGVFAVISSLTIMNSQYKEWYPWSAPIVMVMGMVDPHQQVNWALASTTMGVAFLLPLAISLWLAYRVDVHSG